MVDQAMGIEKKYCLSDVVWTRVMPLLPAHRKRRKGGRPPMDDQKGDDCHLVRAAHRYQWRALPRSLGGDDVMIDSAMG